jgi:hypothetical protein
MANIPGISGYIQPGVFARDRVVSRGVSLPGGIRVVSIMGEGSREITLVESAAGSGQDGVESPEGEINGRFFKLPFAPVISGRTKVFLNGSELFGTQSPISGPMDPKFGYRIDTFSGNIELKGATFADFDGKIFSTNSSNVGLGTIKSLILLDQDIPAESFTIRCSTTVKDSSGSSIPGRAKFTLNGSVSGTSRDSNGNQILFTDTYSKVTDGIFKRNNDLSGGLVLASTSESGLFDRAFLSTDAVIVNSTSSSAQAIASGSSIYVSVTDGLGLATTDASDDESLADKVLVGDSFIVAGVEYIIEAITAHTTNTILTLNKAIAYDGDNVSGNNITDWDIKAFNAIYSATISLTSVDVGKFIRIESSGISQDFTVISVQSADGIIRVEPYNSSEAMPVLTQDDTGIVVELLETNGSFAIGIEKHQTVGFEVGDKFSFKIESNALSAGDKLEASFIYELDLNDPEFFVTSNDLVNKHGLPSLDNNLSLGAQIAFENGAPGILSVQTKPSLPRRTAVTLLAEVSGSGQGGYAGPSGTSAEPDEDDLTFVIPTPFLDGIRQGKPDKDTGVNIFVLRDGKESQIFPNKVSFYNSQYDDASGRQNFVDSEDLAYSYTIVNYDAEIRSRGVDGLLNVDASDSTGNTAIFFSSGIDFDAADVGNFIVIQSGERSDNGTVEADADSIGSFLFSANQTHVLEIKEVVDDNTVKVKNPNASQAFNSVGMSDIQFLVKDSESDEKTAAIVLNRALVRSGAIKSGDGIKISYIDQNDADFFDANFFEAFEKMEAFEAQLIVPLPKQTKSSIFQAAVRHCELMSSVPKRRERIALIGAMQGITPDALVGRKLVAVEDIGVVEGIQGDDPEEILNQDIEDLQNFKLNENFTSNRAVYFYPDQIVRNINGTNVFLDGFYVAAAAAGYLSATQNVAIPLTNKILTGFTILRDKLYRDVTLNELGAVGATVLQPVTGGGRVLAGRTTSQSGFIEDEEISIIFIRDRVKSVLRESLQQYVGGIQDGNTNSAIFVRARSVMDALQTQQVIESVQGIRVERDKVDPRQINVFLRFVPVFPINYIFIDIEVGL